MKKVITYGTYDLLHVGHINLLRRAKELGDYLIVVLSSDEFNSLKHKTAYHCYEDRKTILEAIKYVDEVVPQINRDKYHAWEELHFDVMFVGDDWKGKPLFNELEERFAQVGVKIVFFPYTKGTSSTILRQRLLDRDK